MTAENLIADFMAIKVPRPATREYLHLRMKAMHDIRQLGMKLEAIGKLFGVHHSTVLYACDEKFRTGRIARAATKSRERGSVKLAPAERVKQKLSELRQLGVGCRSIHSVTGVSLKTLARIRRGKQKLIRPETAARILAMDESCIADRAYVRSAATWELLQELIEDGWTERDLAGLLGSKARIQKIHVGVTNVTAQKAMKVRRMYDAIQAGRIQRSEGRAA